MMAMMATLQKLVTKQLLGERDHDFCTRTLNYLVTKSGRHIEPERWMVTAYEVDFGMEIGSGGL
jgi:hypothetical protein